MKAHIKGPVHSFWPRVLIMTFNFLILTMLCCGEAHTPNGNYSCALKFMQFHLEVSLVLAMVDCLRGSPFLISRKERMSIGFYNHVAALILWQGNQTSQSNAEFPQWNSMTKEQ